jgi:hypothetical protein
MVNGLQQGNRGWSMIPEFNVGWEHVIRGGKWRLEKCGEKDLAVEDSPKSPFPIGVAAEKEKLRCAPLSARPVIGPPIPRQALMVFPRPLILSDHQPALQLHLTRDATPEFTSFDLGRRISNRPAWKLAHNENRLSVLQPARYRIWER